MHHGIRKVKRVTLILCFTFLTIALSGCQQFLTVTASTTENTLLFTFNEGDGIYLYDLEMDRADCENNCVMWSVVNKEGENGVNTRAKLKAGQFRYGQKFENLVTKVLPKQLSPGKYIIGGTVTTTKGYGSLFDFEFTLDIDKSGSMTITPIK
jgi:hypothetical protein